MPVAPSFDDLVQQFIAEAQARRPALKFLDGDISLAQAHGSGAMADVVLRYAAQAFKATFLDGAEDDDLTALVDDHYNIQRDPATFASVTVNFARTSSGAAGSIPAGTTIATAVDASGLQVSYTTDAVIAVGAGNNGPFSMTATCTVSGPTGNVQTPGAVNLITDPLFDTFTVTNPAAAGGGNDAETDDELRARARNFWQTLRRGTLASLEEAALQIASVRIAKATEDLATGTATLVVTDADGNSTAQMIADVTAELEDWRAAGCNVTVLGGVPLLVNVTGTMVLADGVDPVPLAPTVQAAIAARISKLRQGETLYIDMIKASGIAVDPDGIDAIVLSTPTADVTPMAGQVVRPGTISMS